MSRLVLVGAFTAALGMLGGWPLLVVVTGVVAMIFLHELGHFVAARLGGMKVTEFFIGFGPRIWSFHRGETEYGLKAIPAGAYVRIVGMNNLDEVDAADEPRTYRQQSYPKRLAVAVAGSAMHFAQALVLLFVLHAFVGIPDSDDIVTSDRWRVSVVSEGSAAEDAGIEVGDRIVAVDGAPIVSFEDLRAVIAGAPGESVQVTVRRDGTLVELPVQVGRRTLEDGSVQGFLGVGPGAVPQTVGPVAAVGRSLGDFGTGARETMGFLVGFFTPSGLSDYADRVADGGNEPTTDGTDGVTGSGAVDDSDDGRLISIVGAVRIGADLTEEGLLGFLGFFVGINITVGVFNLIPLLPLDGGHVVIATYERLREIGRRGRRYHADVARLLPVAYGVVMILVLIGVTSLYLDLIDPVSL